MFKPILMLTLFAGCTALAQADVGQQTLDAAWQQPQRATGLLPSMPLAFDGSGSLTPDLAFGAVGQRAYGMDNANGKEEWALRVFKRAASGWWLVGNHWNGSTASWDAAIVQVAAPDGAANAKYWISTPMETLNDVAFDAATNKLYFAGSAKRSGHTDADMAVTCVDVGATPPVKCSGFGSAGTAYVPIDISADKNDGAARVLVRPNIGVLLVGWAQNGADSIAIATAALYRNSGTLVTRFGSGGTYWIDFAEDETVDAIALSDDPDAQARLYIGGAHRVSSDPGRVTGYVLALNAWAGQRDASFGSSGYVELAPRQNSAHPYDKVSALAPLAGGKLAWAGKSRDAGDNMRMVIGRLKHDGGTDNTFHSAGWVAPLGAPASGAYEYQHPTDMAERPGNRGLVIAVSVVFEGTSPYAGERHQYAFEFDADVQGLRGTAVGIWEHVDGQKAWSIPSGTLVTDDAVMMAGTRRWDASFNDFDFTLVRMIGSDTIFANGFDNAH